MRKGACARYGDNARQTFLQKQLILRPGSIHVSPLDMNIGEARGGTHLARNRTAFVFGDASRKPIVFCYLADHLLQPKTIS